MLGKKHPLANCYAGGGKVKNSSSVNSDPELRERVKSKFGPPASGKADPVYPELAAFPSLPELIRKDKENGVTAKPSQPIPSKMRPRQEKTPPGSSRPIPSSPRKKQSPKVEAKNDSTPKRTFNPRRGPDLETNPEYQRYRADQNQGIKHLDSAYLDLGMSGKERLRQAQKAETFLKPGSEYGFKKGGSLKGLISKKKKR